MKRFALFFSLFMLCLVVKANPVSRSQALKEAKSFLASKGVEMNTSDAAYRAPRKANAQEGESSYYYIFNVGNDEGFVIVSGDDRTEQILGYSDSGSFDEENMPEPLKEWLDGYAKEMESIVEVDANEYESLSPRRAQEKTKKSIAPLTTSKWGNGLPYTYKTPTFNGKHAPAGCAPIAVSQLLYYYKNINVKAITSQINSSIPKGTKLDWDNMLDQYSYKSYNSAQQDAVSNLMYYVGCALGASYTSSGTFVSLTAQHPALKNYFAFYSSMAYVEKEYYSNEDWDNVLYRELEHQRPILYNAFSVSSGHTFLVDGYDSSGLFHINWGWEGRFNGFFRLSVLNREKSGYNTTILANNSYAFVSSHSASLYVAPNSLGEINLSNKILSAKFTSVSGKTITCSYVNQSGKDGSYYLGLGYRDMSGNVKLIKQYSNSSSAVNNKGSKAISYSLLPSDFSSAKLPFGTYNIVPIYKNIDDLDWKVCQFNSDNLLKASLTSNSDAGLVLSYSSTINLKATSISLEGNGLKNNEQLIKVSIANNSNISGYKGYVYFFASTSTSKGSAKSNSYVNLGKNDEVTISFPYTPTTAGTYNVWISTKADGSSEIGKSTITILGNSEPALDISNVDFKINKNYAGQINSKRSIWGNTFDVRIIGIKNNGAYPISTVFTVWLRQFDSVSSSSWNTTRWSTYADNAVYRVIDVYVPAKSEISIPIVFENVKLNTRYDIRVEYNKEATGTNAKIINVLPMVFLPAVTTWKADGTSSSVAPTSSVTIGSDVVAVDITDAAVNAITPNSNSNILYYLGANQKVPTGIANLNVVKGDVAEKITLVDNKNFFVPKRFTAKSINFTTQPKEGVSRGNNNHWTTIALPFEVTSVKNTTDNEIIDWFHSDTDIGKNFWIRKFDRLDTSDNTVIFENAEKMLAYEPYIMNVPDGYWGKKWDLRNKNITFYGENAVLHNEANIGTNSSYYNFVGTTLTKNIDNGWLLNDAGDTFKYVISGTKGTSTIVSPFHAYFMLTSDFYDGSSANSAKSSLRIKFDGDEDSTTGIMAPFAADEKNVDVYNLNGVKVASKNLKNGSVDMSDLPKGIYVVNGKKFIQY